MSDPLGREDFPWRNEDRLRELYFEDGLSLHEIADRMGCTKATIINWMNKFGIERYTRGGTPQYEELSDPEELMRLYVGDGMSAVDIAEMLDCGSRTVYDWLEKHGIERRESGRHLVGASGADHPVWKGGHEENRGHTWPKQRKKALARDGYECQRCGMSNTEHRLEHNQEIHVHHIIRYGRFDSCVVANQLPNLITLCRPCHDELEGCSPREIKSKVKGETLEDAREDMDELKGDLRELANVCRAIQPDVEE